MRIAALAAALAFACVASSSHAGTVRSRSGATAHVADRAVSAFQCLVDRLDASGYRIRFMGGYRRHGSVKHSLHPAGLALDINQYARNITRPRIPPTATSMARACGLIHGEVWGWADAGHFQLGGWAGRAHGKRYARRHHHRKHYASTP